MNPDDRLAIALWEADRHAAALSDALAEWVAAPALDMAQLERDRLLLRLTDQILFRFTKLQDAHGERLVPATLQRLAESFEDWLKGFRSIRAGLGLDVLTLDSSAMSTAPSSWPSPAPTATASPP